MTKRRWSRREVLLGGAMSAGAAAMAEMANPEPINAEPTHSLNRRPSAQTGANSSPRERLSLDFGWRFRFGHANDPAKDFGFGGNGMSGFQKTGSFLATSNPIYDDSGWEPVDLPHDWAIELPFQNDPSLSSKGFYPLGRAYPETSVGWYRRIFELTPEDAGKRISVEFDGVYRGAMVVFNGFYVGQHNGGYDSFSFDLTDFAVIGGPNTLLVRVDATLSDGWFYEGAGIYRHAWLVKTAPVHVPKWGTFVNAQVQPGQAMVSIHTEVVNHSLHPQIARVHSTLLSPSGKVVARSVSAQHNIPGWGEHPFEQRVVVQQPALWSLEERNMYTLVTEVEAGGVATDRYETRFGIRSLRFDPDKGFLLNGKAVKVKGTCNHQDHAGLGVALPDAVQRFRVRKLLEMGCNAYRTSHNPPTPELLDACDELGMLVMDETRMMSSNPEGLNQLANLIRRDRNHPCVFLWSLGNEEREAATEFGARILAAMKRVAHEQDGSRPVTVAPPPFGAMGAGGLEVSEVMGYNYADPAAERFHKEKPRIPVIGTENVSAVGTRGVYLTGKGFVGSYDPYTTTGRASAEGWWRFCNARPWLAGGFVWTGFDYRGEPSPYEWPNISSQYGVIDVCGFPKDTYYYYQAWWTNAPVLHLFPHWNWEGYEGKEITVRVYSNLDRVELFHNGRSLGVKEMRKDSHLEWNVSYAPGVIEAHGFRGSRRALIARRETTGAPAKLVIEADRRQIGADGEDVAALSVQVQDAEGRITPVTDNEVEFRVTGQGRLKGVGNGDPTSHESDIHSTRRAFGGRCMALVQSTGDAGSIRVEAVSPGLESATIMLSSKATTQRPRAAVWTRPVPTGEGVTGLWRLTHSDGGGEGLMTALMGGKDMIFTLRQNGTALTGNVEAVAGMFGNGGAGAIVGGNVQGDRISFRAGDTTYSGTITADRIELHKSLPGFMSRREAPPKAPGAAPRPAIGPPPDGSDPSFPSMDFGKIRRAANDTDARETLVAPAAENCEDFALLSGLCLAYTSREEEARSIRKTSMTIQEYVAEQTIRVAESLAHFLQTTQEDKRDWLPEASTRSAMQQVGECVGVNRYMAKLIGGEAATGGMHDFAFESAEDAQNQLIESANALANAIRVLPDENLERTYQHPRGQIAGKNVIIMPLRNMAYHAGQINFIQTLYGDTEFHVPPTWR